MYIDVACCRGPPAPPLQGNVSSQRVRSEIQANPVPPACVQNAMMTKDKKPFTYTPGGIDLSEIRSPRMAKRIERNAQAPGVGEVPRSPNSYHPSGPLPPSALAAMQTNMPVQVFPSGAVPPPPPPPPPQQQQQQGGGGRSIPPPPPPPPPQGPLPTKPVATNEGTFDRPDMTRIIPENPMAMLRKTPKVERKTFLDELNDMDRQNNRQGGQQYQPRQNNVASPQYQPQVPQAQQYAPPVQQYSPPTQQYHAQNPPMTSFINNSAPSSSNNNQRAQVGALYIPPVTQTNGNNNTSYEVTSPPTPPIRSPQSPQSPQAQLTKAPRPWQNQKREEDRPTWAHKSQERVSPPQEEYIAPPYKPQQEVLRQPEPPRRQQSYQQAELYSPQYQSQPQLVSYPSNHGPNSNMVLNEPPAARSGVEVVWVTQPQVMVHPGVPQQQQQRSPQPQQQQRSAQPQQQQTTWTPPKQQQQVDAQGGIIIPIQVEREQPPTPERNFNRQQSWGAPTQSNSFKVLQKLTSTDGDLEDEGPTTEHGPRSSQEYNQTPADQIRKMKLSSQDDRDLVHKFKQDPMIEYFYYEEDPRYQGGYIPSRVFWILDESDNDFYLHQEVDPRYRGPAIPSKAFRLLQAMTDNYPPQNTSSSNVPRGQPQQSTPHVRNIPIQIEGDDSSGPYVHPSQQTVQEPKKYTGGNIPGRSFKMLQSMTGQTSPLATSNENYESNQPYNPYAMYPPPSPFLPYPPYDPYWSNYFHAPPQIDSEQSEVKSQENQPTTSRSTTPNICSSCRNTPVPVWNYYYPYSYHPTEETVPCDQQQYQHMWHPYYYPYYYCYPPVQTPPLSKNFKRRSNDDLEKLSLTKDNETIPKHLKSCSYVVNSEASVRKTDVPKNLNRHSYTDFEDWSSGNDEIAFYTQQAKEVPQEILTGRKLQVETISPNTETDCEDIQEDERQLKKFEETLEAEDEDSTDSEEDHTPTIGGRNKRSGSLQSVKSVKDMKILSNIEEDKISDLMNSNDKVNNDCEIIEPNFEEYKVEEASTTECDREEPSLREGEDTMPHVLSVIFEESDFSNSASRASSVLTNASDDTIVLEEENGSNEVVSVKLPLKLAFTINCNNEDVTEITVGAHEVKTISFDQKNVDTECSFNILANAEIEDSKSIIEHRKSSSNSSEIDFWSEIITEEEVVPKANRLEEYKNAIQDVEVVTDKTIEKSDVDSTVCINQFRKSSYDIVDVDETDNSSQVIHISNYEMGVSSFEFNKTNSGIDNDTMINKTSTNKINPRCESFNKSSSVEETEDSIVIVNVEDYKLSNLTFERQEDRQVLAAPKLDLDVSVEEFCSKIINSKLAEIEESKVEEKACDFENDIADEYDESSSDFEDQNIIQKLLANSQEFNNFDYTTDNVEDLLLDIKIPTKIDPLENEKPANENTGIKSEVVDILKVIRTNSNSTDCEEEVKTNDTVKEVNEESRRRSTLDQVEDLLSEVAEVLSTSNSRSLSRSSSTSGKEPNKEFSEGEDSEADESGSEEEDHETPVIDIEQELASKNDQNNNEEVLLEVPSIKDRIKSLQEASCKPIKKIIATIEVPKGTNKLPNIIQSTQNKSIDNSEDEGDSGVTSDMSRHISDSESEFSELRKLSRYQRAATHSRLFQLLHSSCSDEELELEAVAEDLRTEQVCEDTNTTFMKQRREHLNLPLKKNIESEFSSGLTSPASPLTDKLAYELVLSLLRKNKGQMFKSMPMERLHAAALKILQEDKDCKDLSGSEEFHNCLSPLRTDTAYSTPAETPAEFYSNSTYNDYYASWKNYDQDNASTAQKKATTDDCTKSPKCPRVPLVPKPQSKAPPDHVPS